MTTKNKWCLILGVSSGIGQACARSLSEAGWNILGVHFDIAEREQEINELKSALEKNSERVVFFNRNADSKKERLAIVEEIAEITGEQGVELMLHSLAFGTLLPFIKTENVEVVMQKNQMDMTLSVMAHSLVYWTQDLWEKKLLPRGGKIFAMTSGGSVMYSQNYGAVSAAKCALESHCKQLATELAPFGIMVNAIRAGVTDTPSLKKIPEFKALIHRAESFNPHGRLSTPEDIGIALRDLSEMQHSWMTGNVINIDGGEILTI
ncbi:SDR family oxidoreductase [Aliikangiella maris]|uniref:SDR family oxidoreductase n=2 Tax=Aliikangiella maris TaxID=3162458 RepID=A0ABV3MPU4_9GAMM